MTTVCANCGAEGPLTRAAGVGPLCVPTAPAVMREKFVGLKDPKIAACNGRRSVIDEHNNGNHTQPNKACRACMTAVPA